MSENVGSTSESNRCRRQSVFCGHERGRWSRRGDRVSVAMIPARADPASSTSNATAASFPLLRVSYGCARDNAGSRTLEGAPYCGSARVLCGAPRWAMRGRSIEIGLSPVSACRACYPTTTEFDRRLLTDVDVDAEELEAPCGSPSDVIYGGVPRELRGLLSLGAEVGGSGWPGAPAGASDLMPSQACAMERARGAGAVTQGDGVRVRRG